MTDTNDITGFIEAALTLPRWSDGSGGWGEGTLHVDRGGRLSGLVRLHGGPRGWNAFYYETYHAYRKTRLARTNPYYDDGIYSEMSKPSAPVRFPLSKEDPVATFRDIEQTRDRTLLESERVVEFRNRLLAAFQACLTAPGDPWESGDTLELPTGGYVQWTRVDEIGTPLHVEVADGSDFSQPLTPRLVEILTDLGWEAPDETFRNAWARALSEQQIHAAVGRVIVTAGAMGVEPFSFGTLARGLAS